MRIPSKLRRSRAGGTGSLSFVPVQVALAATAFLLTIGGLSLALLSHAKSPSPAPAFLSAALGEQSNSASSRSTAATRTFATMKTSVDRRGVRVTAPWAHARLSSLDAGNRPWTSFKAGAVRSTAFGSETITLAGMSAEEFLTVKRRQGPRTWRWTLDSSSRPRVTPNGGIEFLDAHGRPVLMNIAAPAILDRNGKRLATGPLHWQVTKDGGQSVLTLRLDDTRLPVPYTIDPAITLTASAYTVVKGAGSKKAGTFSVTIPAGSQAGDMLVVQYVVRDSSAQTTPSGWTLLDSTVDTTDSLAQYMYFRVMQAGDVAGTTAFTQPVGAGLDAAGGMITMRGVDTSPMSPAQVKNFGTNTSGTASTTVTTDPFVGSNNDSVVAFYGGMGSMGFTETNPSMSPVWTASSENQMGGGNGTFTPSNSNVSSGSSGSSRADSLVTSGSFGAGTVVTPSASLSTSGPWIMNVLAFRVALPWNQTAPSISGTVAVGQALTAANGTWSNTPTGYTYQWQRCDAAGANCVAIAGATGGTYTLTSADSGSTIVVQVTASNANGTGQTATSSQTAVVPASDGSGTLTSPTSTVTAGSTGNTIAFTYTAAGPTTSGKVRLTVPGGWTAPSLTGSNGGYTTSSAGTVAVAGQMVTVSNVTLATGGTVTITYGSRASSGPGATAPTAAGAQTWSGASAATSGGTLTALAASPSITVNPAAANKLVWTTQPSNTGSGSAISASPAASIEDTYGNVVTSSSATVTAAIGTNPGGGTLAGTTSVAAVSGVATFSNLSINKSGTGYTLTAASAGVTGATSSGFNITAGAPSKLAFVQGPSNVVAGSSISPSVTVAVEDAAGNTVTTSSAAVTVAVGTNPSGGTLSGTTTVNAVSGIATFSTLSLDKAGTGYTLAASSGALTGSMSGSFNVTPGSASKLAFVQGPTSATAGAAISPAITVAVTDAFGNTITSSSASVTLAIGTNPGGGTLSGTKTVSASAGVATFSTLSIDKGGSGYTLAATSTGLSGATSSSFSINVGAVSSGQSTVSASPTSLTANGVASSTITVTAEDAFGNPVAGQPVSLSQGSGSSTITTVSGTTSAAGAATFTATDTKAESVTYTATIGATGVLQTAGVAFVAGPVSAGKSTVAASPGSVTADGSSASTVTVALADAHSNPVAGKTVALVKDGGSSTVTAVSAITDASGQATFTVTDTTAEDSTYTATDTTDGVTVTQHAAVTFTPGPATHFTLSVPPTATAGAGFAVTATALDAHENIATGYTGTVHLTSTDNLASLPADASASAGVATFTGATLKTSGSWKVTATDGGISGTSASIAVDPAAAASFTVSAPGSATAGTGFGVTVTAHDAYGNVATGYTGTVHLTSSDVRAALPADVAAAAGVASFTGVTLKSAGSSTVTATDGPLTGASGSISVSAGAAATFTVSAPTSATAGSGFSVSATAYDAYGNPADDYTGTVSLASGDGAAVLPGDTTATAGVATFNGVQLRTAGTQSLTAADGAVTGSANVSVSAASAASFDVSAPGSATAGSNFSVTVTARDAFGNLADGYSGSVHHTSSDGAAALPADSSATNGVVTVTGVTLKTSGTQSVTAADGAVTGTSGSIDVGAAAASTLSVTGASTATAGVQTPLTVTAHDAYGNVATGYTGAHPVTFSGASDSASPVTVPTVTDDSGSAVDFGSATELTFTGGVSSTGGSATFFAAESATIAATASGLSAGGTLAVSVSPGAFAKFAFALSGAQVNGAAFGGVDSLTAEDAYGNVDTGFNAFGDHVTISANGALTGAVSGLSGADQLNAAVDFTNGTADLAGLLTYTGVAGAGTFTATAATGETGVSGPVTIAAGAAAGFVVTGSATQTAGQPQTLDVRAVDASGNTASSYTGDHDLTFSGASTLGSFAPTVAGTSFGTPTTLSFTNGAATGSLVLYKAESATIAASAASLATAPADRLAVDVSPDAVSTLELAASTSSPVAGAADALTLTARDAFGNVATGYTGDKTLTFGGATTAGSFAPTVTGTSGTPVAFGSPTTIRFANGVSSLGGSMKLYTAETATVTVTDGSHGNGAGTAFAVSAAAPSALAVASVNGGSNPTAGIGFPVVVQAVDDYGNRSGVSAATGFSLSAVAGTGTLGGTTTGSLSAGQSQATVTGVTYTKAESGVRIGVARTSGDSLAGGTSASFTVASNADRLAVSSVNGGSSPTAGQPFSVTVRAQDGLGNTSNVVSDTTVTVSVFAGSGSLSGTVTATIPAGQSQATVAGLTYTVAESGVQLRAAASGGDSLLAATSSAFTVAPAAADHFSLAGSGTETAGTPDALTITAYDAYGNVATGYTGDHSLTFSGASTIGSFVPTATRKDGTAVAFGSATTVSFAGGVSTAGAALVLYRAETAHVAAADGGIATSTPLDVDVSAATAASLSVSAPATSAAGSTFVATATALDAYGNTDTSFGSTVTLGTGDSVPASAGVAAFSGVRLDTAGTQTLTASAGSLTGAASITVTPAAATHFSVTAPAAATAGAGFAVTVTALDPYGNTDTSYAGTVQLAGDSATAAGGIASFSGVTLTAAGVRTLTAQDGSLTGEATVVVGAAAATHFSVSAPASATAGSAFAVTVTALDQYGNTDDDYTGTVQLAGDSAAAANGIADFAAVTLTTAGARTLTAQDGSLTGTASVDVGPAAATHFSVAAPANAVAGTGFAVTVTAVDPYGNTDTNYTGTVQLAGDSAAATSGVASFTGVELTAAGARTITAQDGSLTGDATVSVTAGAATHFAVSAPASVTAGTGFGVTVTALDAYGNTDTSYGGTVQLAGDSATAASGTASFAGVELTAAGTQTLTAQDGSLTGNTSVTVDPATATHFSVSAPANAVAGTGFAVAVTALDAYGNTDTNYTGTVQLAGDSATAASGIAGFSGVTLTSAGARTLTASDGAITGSTNVTVAPAAAASLVVTTSAASATAGDPLDVTVTAKDAYGNLATGYRGTVALTSGDSRATLASAHAFGSGDAGSYTYTSGVAFGTAGTQTVSAGDSTISGTSSPVSVSAGAPAALAFGGEPPNGSAGSALAPAVTIQVVDAFGNPTASSAAVSIALAGSTGATLSGTLTETAAAGVATFADLSLDKAGSGYRLDASASGLAGATSSAFSIGAGAPDAAQSTLALAPSSVTADGSSAATVTVQAHDAFGNVVQTGGATVALATTLGVLSAVTDHHDGTYTAALTSTSAGGATVSGTLGGSPLANTGAATFNAGSAPNAARSSITAAPTSLTAGSPSTLTVQARDAFGNDLAAGGATVVLSTDLGTIGAVVDNGDGTYTATLDSNAAGVAHVGATVNGEALAGTTVSFVPGAVSAGTSTVTAGGSSVSTDGAGTTVTVVVEDARGNPIPSSHVTLAHDGGSSTIDPILGTDTDSSGIATFTVADTTAETVVYSATAAGTLLTPTATVQYLPGAASAAQSSLAASPGSITAGGSATITVRLCDAHGNALTSGGDAVTVASDSGTVGAVTDNGDGTYSATLTATQAGTAHLSATAGGTALPGTASVSVGPAAADAAQSTITATPTKINADGTSGDATITVQLRDTYGNALRAGGASVDLASSLGTLSSVDDKGDGTYSATLSATGAIGTAHVTGTLAGTAIGDSADVVLAPPVPTAVVDSAPSGTIASGSASIVFHSGNDPGATFECKLDGGAYAACSSPQPLSGLADGAHTFTVRGVNVNGPGPGVSASWTSDTTPPDATLTTAPGAYTNASTEPLAASASDETSGVASVDFLFAPAGAPCSTGTLISTVTTAPYATTWTLPADGKYVVCAVAHDAAGNSSTASTSDVVVDTAKPTIAFPSLGTLVGSDYWIRGSVDLHTTSSDQTSGVASVGFAYTGAQTGTIGTLAGAGTGGTTDSYDEGWDTTTVADGNYIVTATSTDEATNADDATQTLKVDNTAPTASLDDPGAFGHGTIPLSVTASDTGSGVNTSATLVQSSPHDADTWTTIADPSTWTPADGNYDLRAVVTDNVGNQTITALRTILVDNTPPNVTSDADSAWHANDVTVTLDAVDDESGVATVEYKLDSGAWTSGTSVVVPATDDGVHTITYHATNRAGVTSADATAAVKIDHTPPSNVSLDAPAAGALLHGTLDATGLAGTAQDATSGIASTTFRLAPAGSLGANPCNTFGSAIAPPFDTKSVADGSYDMWYVAVDAAGNGRCSVVPHTVTIDNTPPSTTDDAPFGARNTDVTVHLTATDATSGVASTEYSVDGGAWTTGNTVTVAAAGHEGTNTIQYRSTDNAGNVEPTKTATVVIDTTAPAGTAEDPNSILRGTVQLTASPTDPDIASVEWLYRPVGGSSWTEIGTDTDSPWELPWITTGLPDGAYELEAISTDSTGNQTTQLFSTKTVDNSDPDSATMTAPNANADLHGTIAFSSSATDATSGIDASRTVYQVKTAADSDFQTISGDHWDSTATPDGPAEVRVAVWDRAGNGPLYSPSVTFTVDNSAPTVQLSAPAATNGDAALGASGSADIASVQYAYRPHGGGSWTTIASTGAPFGTTWSTNGLPEGEYDVQVTATDGGGNTGTATGTVLVDRTAPTVSLTAPAAEATVGGSAVALSGSASDAASGVDTVVYGYRPHGSGSFTTISGSSWDVSGLASGDYDVQALVTDHAGNTSTDMHTVTVDSTPPAVSAFAVASPQHGTVSLHVTADATAAKVTYGITPAGGTSWSQVGGSTTAPSFTGSFDSTSVPDGDYDFRAIVADSLGNETTVDVPNVTIDNTAPTIVSSTPADGSIVTSASSITATASEPVASVSSLELDGRSATFTATETGNDLTFPTGTLLPGNHALTGNLIDAAGNSLPFRINLTVDAGAGQNPITAKNTNAHDPTTLPSADGGTLVTVPANVWQHGVPQPHDWLVLEVNPSPAPWEIPASGGTLPGSVVDVRMFWDLAHTEEHQFDAPIEVDLIDPSGADGTPATAEAGASWRAIPALDQAGTLPAGQPDGYWRTGATVHVLTRHLSLFTLLVGSPAGALPAAAGLSPVPPPIDFSGVFATDGLTLRWAPGMDSAKLSDYTLYADGVSLGTFGPTTYEAKLGPVSADDARRFTIVERSSDGVTSGPSPALRVVPAVAGLTVQQASAALAARHLLTGNLVAVPSTAPAGTVVGPTDLALLVEGSTVDLQVSDGVIARSPFAFSVATAPSISVGNKGLVARVGLTTRARVDVTIDAYPYVRIHRWHFFHVPAGTKTLDLRLGRLKPGQYRLFWKATSEADHTVQRTITPLRIEQKATAPKNAAIVVVSNGRSAESAGSGLFQASVEQAFLYATYHEVRGFVVEPGAFEPTTVSQLVAVYPHRAVVVLTRSAAAARAARRAGASTLPASATRRQIAALVAKLDR